MVNFEATLDDGMILKGNVEDGQSWRAVRSILYNDDVYIVELKIINEGINSATIDKNKDGYVIGNKVIASMQGGDQVKLVAIGYWSKSEDVAHIKWYNAETMDLVYTEARPTDACGFFLIKNPKWK